VAFVSLREQIDTASLLGRAVFVIVGAIAELERSLIVERVRAGLRRARAQGKRLGRPKLAVDVAEIRRAVERAGSIRKAAKGLGRSEATLRNRLGPAD
jgi:DNA invertase Pin-like site-specific DNA recombinase